MVDATKMRKEGQAEMVSRALNLFVYFNDFLKLFVDMCLLVGMYTVDILCRC